MRTHSHATVYINPYIIFHGGKLIRLDSKQANKCKEANSDVEITYNQSTLSYYDGKTFRCKISNQYGNAYTAPVTVKMVGESFVYGDVNGDKEIDSVDLTRLKKNLAGQPVVLGPGKEAEE